MSRARHKRIYVMLCGRTGHVKVGMSGDPRQRAKVLGLKLLFASDPVKHAASVEAGVHSALRQHRAPDRLLGRSLVGEFFDVPPAQAQAEVINCLGRTAVLRFRVRPSTLRALEQIAAAAGLAQADVVENIVMRAWERRDQ